MSPALFVSLEGPEGGGKTTQAQRLIRALSERGYRVVGVREPGGTALGERLREVILEVGGRRIDPRSETLLFCAARARLVEEVLKPALAAGAVVVADRFSDSTLAYQGYGRGLDSRRLGDVISFATNGLAPDLTFLLDLPVEVGLARKRGASAAADRFETESVEFHRAVRQGFLELAGADPRRWQVLDAQRPEEDLARDILEATLERLRRASA